MTPRERIQQSNFLFFSKINEEIAVKIQAIKLEKADMLEHRNLHKDLSGSDESEKWDNDLREAFVLCNSELETLHNLNRLIDFLQKQREASHESKEA